MDQDGSFEMGSLEDAFGDETAGRLMTVDHPAGVRVAHAAPPRPPKRTVFGTILGVLGELLITAAFVLGLYVVWQLWWTTASVAPVRQANIEQFQDSFPTPADTDGFPVERTDPPPPVGTIPENETYGVMHIPKWDWMQIPLAQGTNQWILDQAFAGHYMKTQQVGEVGNFAVAAHRATYGNGFRYVHFLEPGDPIIVETADAYVVYAMDSFEIVQPDQSEVLYPVPHEPDTIPTERIMTMTTCHPEFGSSERYIVYSKFQYWTDKSEGIPEVLKDEPRG